MVAEARQTQTIKVQSFSSSRRGLLPGVEALQWATLRRQDSLIRDIITTVADLDKIDLKSSSSLKATGMLSLVLLHRFEAARSTRIMLVCI